MKIGRTKEERLEACAERQFACLRVELNERTSSSCDISCRACWQLAIWRRITVSSSYRLLDRDCFRIVDIHRSCFIDAISSSCT